MGKSRQIITDLDKFQEQVDIVTGDKTLGYVKSVVSDIKRTLYDNPDLVCLCAPQVGENLRLFVVRNGRQDSERFKVFINPMIVSAEGFHLSRETNASLPNKQFIIPRRDKIHVAFQEVSGEVNSLTFISAYAEVVQQMIEMLDGITLEDYGLDLDLLATDELNGIDAFDQATEEERVEVLTAYLEQLKTKLGDLKIEIENTPKLKEIDNYINFSTEVLKGNIKPIDEHGEIVDEEYIKKHAKEIAKERVDEILKNREKK